MWSAIAPTGGSGVRISSSPANTSSPSRSSRRRPPRRQSRALVTVSPQGDGLGAFGQRVAAAIAQAVARLAGQVKAIVEAREIPFLIGPTGVAKTSAVRALATAQGWGFEEVAGAPSFADADLVGVKMAGGVEIPGVFARAFQRARDGETVLLFLECAVALRW